jgi:hypothetical protein
MHRFESRLLLKYVFLFAIMVGCSNDDQSKDKQASSAVVLKQQDTVATGSLSAPGIVEQTTLLAETKNLFSQDPNEATHTPLETIKFSANGRGIAYIEVQNDKQRVIHNGKPGAFYSEVSHLTISPDGKRTTYCFKLGDKFQVVSDGVVSYQLYNDVFDARYSQDSRHVAYLAQTVDTMAHIVLDGKSIEVSPSAVSAILHFTDDSSRLLYHIHPKVKGKQARLVIYDLKSGKKILKDCLDTQIIVNSAKNIVALAVSDGDKQRVIDFNISAPDDIHKSATYDEIANFSLATEGNSICFVGIKGGKRFMVLNGKEERLPNDLAIIDTPVIRPDLKGVGVILATTERHNRRFSLHESLFIESASKKQYAKISDLVYSSWNSSSAYVAMEADRYYVVVNGKEGPDFDKAVSPTFSHDGRKLVYRARKGEKRMLVVVDVARNETRTLNEYEMVFPAVFTSDGKSVAYGVKDENKLIWKVEKL